ncbi:MAG: hypothetical protein LBQ38_13655 [Spirochaetaceae bacterium]|jgi:hypothetical protein|nr:hypothetical protein [Spirochaetaceae bacterium]
MKGILIAGFVAVLGIAGCGKLDVVGKQSIVSFQAVLNALPREIGTDGTSGGWVLFAPDDSAQFIWSKNYRESPRCDVMIVFDARPFINAGLDPSKLPGDITVSDNRITVGTKLGDEALSYKGEPTPMASYEQIVNLKRDSINYHGALDHYGINLSKGNLFEWAKDMGKNDKDIVFVLNPEPFIAAGLDPNRLEGWVFTKVPVDDENGKPIEVDKILKPFDLL